MEKRYRGVSWLLFQQEMRRSKDKGMAIYDKGSHLK
jgi:hypothetical protein